VGGERGGGGYISDGLRARSTTDKLCWCFSNYN